MDTTMEEQSMEKEELFEVDSLDYSPPTNDLPAVPPSLPFMVASPLTIIPTILPINQKDERSLSQYLYQLQKVIQQLTQTFLHLRHSSLRSLKPHFQARRAILYGIKHRLEEIRILYRISLTKRYQFHRQYCFKEKPSSFMKSHVQSSPLEYQMLHMNSSLQLLIQPEHFPRMINTSGLPSKTRIQSPTRYPPSTSQKHVWIDYGVRSSVVSPSSSLFSPTSFSPRSSLEKKNKKNVTFLKTAGSTEIRSLWEGTEYKLQLLSSLYEKLMMKFIWELWRYGMYVDKLIRISQQQIQKFKQKIILQLSFDCFKYYYLASHYVQLVSEKKATLFFQKRAVKPLFTFWKETFLVKKQWRRKQLSTKAERFHHLYLQRKYWKEYHEKIFLWKKRKLLKQFTREYAPITLLLTIWRKWQIVFIRKHLLRVEMIRLYHPDSSNKSIEINLSAWNTTNLQAYLHYYHHSICDRYKKALVHLLNTFKHRRAIQRVPKRVFSNSAEEEEEKEEEEEEEEEEEPNIMGEYLQNHALKRQFEQIHQDIKKVMIEVMESKQLLPHARFNPGGDSPNFGGNRIKRVEKSRTTLDQSTLNAEFGSNYESSNLYERPLHFQDNSIQEYSTTDPYDRSTNLFVRPNRRRLKPVANKDVKFSQQFSDRLLNLSLNEDLQMSFEEDPEEEEAEGGILSVEKQSALWKLLQLKKIDRFVKNAFHFFQIMKDTLNRKHNFQFIQYHHYHRKLYGITLQKWKSHYQHRVKYQENLYDQYYTRKVRIILQNWRQYLQNKYYQVLKKFKSWRYHFRLFIIWKQWRTAYEERKIFYRYLLKVQRIVKKYNFKHWKKYILSFQQQRKKVYQIYRQFFYRKFFQLWHEKYQKRALLKRVFTNYSQHLYEQYYEETSFTLIIKSNFHCLNEIFQSWKQYSHQRKQKRLEEHQLTSAFYFRGLHLYSNFFMNWKIFLSRRKQIRSFAKRQMQRQLQRFFFAWKQDYPKYLRYYQDQKTLFLQHIIRQKRFFKHWQRLCYSRWQTRQSLGQQLYQQRQQQFLHHYFQDWSIAYRFHHLQRKTHNQRQLQNQQSLQHAWAFWKRLRWKNKRYLKGLEIIHRIFYEMKKRKAFYSFPSYQLKLKLNQFSNQREEKKKKKREKSGLISGVRLVDINDNDDDDNDDDPNDKKPAITKMAKDMQKEKTGNEQQQLEDGEEEEKSLSTSSKEDSNERLLKSSKSKSKPIMKNYSEEEIDQLFAGESSIATEIGKDHITTDAELAKRLLSLNKRQAFAQQQQRNHDSNQLTQSFIKERKVILPINERAYQYGYTGSLNDFIALRDILILLKTVFAYWSRFVQKQKLVLLKYKALVTHRRNLLLEKSFTAWMKMTPRIAYRFVTWLRNRRQLS